MSLNSRPKKKLPNTHKFCEIEWQARVCTLLFGIALMVRSTGSTRLKTSNDLRGKLTGEGFSISRGGAGTACFPSAYWRK